MAVRAGQEAPDFDLNASTLGQITLSSFRGKQAVALVFYAMAFDPVDEAELCALRDELALFEAADCQVLAISCDQAMAQRVWAGDKDFGFPLLCDYWPYGKTAGEYDAFDESRNRPRRVTVVIDKEGAIVDRFESDDTAGPRSIARYKEALEKL